MKLLEELAPLGVTRCFHHVDNFLVCTPLPANLDSAIFKIMEQFRGLHVVHTRNARKKCLHFLNLFLKEEFHTRWAYHMRGEKGLLLYGSLQTKLIMHGIVTFCIK